MELLGVVFVAMALCNFVFFVNGTFCPDRTATLTMFINEPIEKPNPAYLTIPDPELTFFRDVMGLRDDDIQHVLSDAIKFSNETYGLDFSRSPPNDQGQLFFENALMFPYRFRENPHFTLVFNNWIQTGNTHHSCEEVLEGGYLVIFTGEQLLHGTYGGEEGIKIDPQGSFLYAFNVISICDQSPVVIQVQNETPFRLEPIDLTFHIDYNVYNNVLGHGKAYGGSIMKPDPENPGKYRFVTRNVFNFPG